MSHCTKHKTHTHTHMNNKAKSSINYVSFFFPTNHISCVLTTEQHNCV
jgi:hypothetical protein